jgi:hypothetical protein
MKNWMFMAIAVISLAACKMDDKKAGKPGKIYTPEQIDSIKNDTTRFTTIQWLDSLPLNLGKMVEGDKKEVAFRFKNTGDKPLVIMQVKGTCGCTVAEQPEGAILPGEEGVIKAIFSSSSNMVGIARKTVTVLANTNPSNYHELTFQAEVTKK